MPLLIPSSNLRTLDTASVTWEPWDSNSSMISGWNDPEATMTMQTRSPCKEFKIVPEMTELPFQSYLVLTPPPWPSVVGCVCVCECVCVLGISGQFLAPRSSRAFRPALNSPCLCWTPASLFCLSHSSLIHPLHLFYPSFSSALKPECPFPPSLLNLCTPLSLFKYVSSGPPFLIPSNHLLALFPPAPCSFYSSSHSPYKQ